MTVPDANLLLYAYSPRTQQHEAAARWLTGLFESKEVIGIAWVTIWAFVRILTTPRIWNYPTSAAEALATVAEWLSFSDVVVLHPGPRHLELLQRLVVEYGAVGPLVTDAVLAAIAIEHGATLASSDGDFARFRELRWINPLAQTS